MTAAIVLGWLFGLFFVLGGLGGLASGHVVPGLCTLIVGLVLLPPVGKLAAKKTGRRITAAHKAAVVVLCLAGAALTMPKELRTSSDKHDPGASRSQETVEKPETPPGAAANAKKGDEPKKPTEAHLKDQIAVGDFVYRVDQIRFEKTLGNQFMEKTANGIYLLVGVAVMNRSKETRTLDASMFQIVDARGNRYDYSIDGAIMVMGVENFELLLLKQCQPSIATSGVLVFEVPRESDEYMLAVTGGLWSAQKGHVRLAEKAPTP